ncbi:MAG TPA: SprT family zinc-dependent metalloprotease [Candidatus Saccharimonadales bacterium]
MPVITDEEFGEIVLRRSARASQVRIRVAPDGRLRASLPLYAPVFLVKRLVKSSREQLRAMLNEYQGSQDFEHGMQIGKSHTLIIRNGGERKVTTRRHGQQIVVTIPEGADESSPLIQRSIRDEVISAYRLEAKSYLPKRLAFLAGKHGFSYEKVRFSHASGRWGSCNSNGTISLNIALMKLPFELIDYVLIHELSHTLQMNHSEAFWNLVAKADPNYKAHRRSLKNETPSI